MGCSSQYLAGPSKKASSISDRIRHVQDAGQRQARRVQGSVDTMLGMLLCRVFLWPGHASVLRRREGMLLHTVGRPGVPSLLDGAMRGATRRTAVSARRP